MRLNRLAVTDYRNLSAAVLEPAPQLTVLCGANGQGKTNLLESKRRQLFFTFGKSM